MKTLRNILSGWLLLASCGCHQAIDREATERMSEAAQEVHEDLASITPSGNESAQKQRFIIELTMDNSIKKDGQIISREQLQDIMLNLQNRPEVEFWVIGSLDLNVSNITELQRFMMECVSDVNFVGFMSADRMNARLSK